MSNRANFPVDTETATRYDVRDLHPVRSEWIVPFPGRVFIMRTIVLIDGQNLYHLARAAWGTGGNIQASPYNWPSYDVAKLAAGLVALTAGRTLEKVCFYTAVARSGRWHTFWTSKLRRLRNQGIAVTRGTVIQGREKGSDVSLAIDLVTYTYEQEYDVVIIVSEDWDYAPAVRRAKEVASRQGRSLTFESAFPVVGGKTPRGIPGTRFFPVDKTLYDTCLEPSRYRPT